MSRGTFLLLSLLVVVPSFAGPDPNVRRGIAPGNAYRVLDIDTINEFSGSLILRIPLAEAPVGPMLTQSLQLTYNSTVYDYQFVQHQNYPDDTLYKRRAMPETFSNSGLGWSLSLGRLVPPRTGTPVTPHRGWHYRSPNGSEHDFTNDLGDVSEAITRDGSFLRLERYPSSLSQAVTYREIEMPDGTVHRFNPDGYPTEIRDRLNHKIEVDYSDPMKWVIRNTYNGTGFRTTTVHFENRTALKGTYAPNFQKVVKSIDVPAFAGTTATYEFSYEDAVLKLDGCGDKIEHDPEDFPAPLLKEILLPEGLKYELAYKEDVTGAECTVGLIKAAKLPSHGSIEWTYQDYRLTQDECDDLDGWIVKVPGVHKRILKDAANATVGTWTYETDINLNPGTKTACGAFDGHDDFTWGPAPTLITTTVTTTVGDPGTTVGGKSIRYFSGTKNQHRATALGHHVAEYGLPFTRTEPDSTNPNRFLSSERFDEEGTLVRSTFLTYKGSGSFDARLVNARVQGELTVFDDDTGCSGKCRIDIDRPESEYDQFGHYRKSVTTSNFGPTRTRTTFTNYTPSTNPWILGTYDLSWVEEDGAASKQLFTFDSNGILRTQRTLVGAAATAGEIVPDSTDLLQVYCRDSRGFLTSERFFGGDGTTALIPTGDPCTASPAATEYQINHEFTFNTAGAPTRHTAKYANMPFFIADEDLDVNTALVSTSRDLSGVATSFKYDALQRLTEVKPTGAAWTLFQYTESSDPVSLRTTTRASGTGSTATPLTDAYVYYDGMGRPIQQKVKTPSDDDVEWATTNTAYDLFSRPTNVSVPEFRTTPDFETDFVPTKKTITSFDVFGRPTSVTGPDGKTQSNAFTGDGVRESSRTAEVQLTTGPTDVTTTNRYDAYGRLIEVEEATEETTRYAYDLNGQLSNVCQNTTDGGTTCGQSRTFTRDNRGLLVSETHVENGTVTYLYDAKGNPLSRSVSGDAQSEANLAFTYDGAERLTDVHHLMPTYRLGKKFTFGPENTGTDEANKTLGKLTSATRYNYTSNGLLTVKETYDYDDPAGRRSKTTTEIMENGSLLQTLVRSQTYAAVGNLGTLTYPTCITVSCGTARWNSTTFDYTNGFLTDVSRFVSDIGYTAAGAVSSVEHVSPVTDTYEADETGLRPKSITFEGHMSCAEPAITFGSPEDQSVMPGQTATLSVLASGEDGYRWYESDGTKISGQTGSSFTTPPLMSARSYFVEVYNDCMTVKSRIATVTVCPQLQITTGTPENDSIAPGETATLTVTATGATAYQWYEGNGTPLSGATSPSFTTPALTSTKTYYVEASNDCETKTSRTATVTVCPQLSITSSTPQNKSIAPEETATLTVSATGATSYQWYEGNGTLLSGATSSSFTTPALTTTKTYYVEVSNDCETKTSRTATVTVRSLSPPTGLVATASGTSSVSISWNASTDADHYVLERKSNGSGFVPVQDVYQTSWTNSGLVANRTYVYRVRAVSPSEQVSSDPSNTDLATTILFSPLVAGETPITVAHFEELLTAVNALRAANGTAAATWTNLLPAEVPAPAPGVTVDAEHILSLRSAMNSARAALGFASPERGKCSGPRAWSRAAGHVRHPAGHAGNRQYSKRLCD